MNAKRVTFVLALCLACTPFVGAEDAALRANPDRSDEHQRVLTLPRAIALVLERNPGLAAFSWDIRAADAHILQAGLLPNPEFSVEIEEVRWTTGPSERTRTWSLSGSLAPDAALGWEQGTERGARSGFSESEITASLAQVIELGGKRAKRVSVAKGERQRLLWDYEAARAEVLAETARAFIGTLAAQQRLALQDELVELAKEAARTAQRRVQAGAVSPLEGNRAEIALATTRVGRDQAARALTAARARLAALWSSREPQFGAVAGALAPVSELPPLDALEAELKGNPDIARWAAELALREARFRNERVRRIPDLTVELGFRSKGLADRSVGRFGFDSTGGFGLSRSDTEFDSDRNNSLVLGFSLPLPLFDRNQGNIAAAEYGVSKTRHERMAAETSAWAWLVHARESAAAAADEVQALDSEVLPKAEETFAKTQRGYQEGKFSYLDVLDAQRTLFDVRTSHLDALERYGAAVVDIERLTGRALQNWTQPEEPSEEEDQDE